MSDISNLQIKIDTTDLTRLIESLGTVAKAVEDMASVVGELSPVTTVKRETLPPPPPPKERLIKEGVKIIQ